VVKKFILVLFIAAGSLSASERRNHPLEIGVERFVATAPSEAAAFSGVLLNYWLGEHGYIGTTQMLLYYRGQTEYRPDFRFGLIFPLFDSLYIEGAIGVDFWTALIIALAIADEDSSLDYQFASSFYSPYFTFTTSLRLELGDLALKLIGQTQLGGYLDNQNQAFNASLWLGLGATYRLNL